MRDNVVLNALNVWAEKAGPAPPDPVNISQAGKDDLAQLNFKVSRSMKSRIKQLAARDNISLLAMLYLMVELYESKHGALISK
jgi:hypothetical protein